jgi:hypothetical protein
MEARSAQHRGILMGRYKDLDTTLHLDRFHFRDDVRRIFESIEEEYLALEARFTKRERTPDGIMVSIGSFSAETDGLEKRFWAKLEAVIGRSLSMEQVKKQLPEHSLFPFGRSEARIELQRENGQYHGKVYRTGRVESKGAPISGEALVEDFSGPELPPMYKRFWIEPLQGAVRKRQKPAPSGR